MGDDERQSAAEQLQAHYAAGRLTWEELDARLGVAWAARTGADLTPLFDDLPPIAPPPPASPDPRRPPAWRRFDHRLLVVLATLLVAAGLVYATGGFILIPVLFWLFGGRHHHSHHHPRGRQFDRYDHHRQTKGWG